MTPLQEGPLTSDLEHGDVGLYFALRWGCQNNTLLFPYRVCGRRVGPRGRA